MLESCQCYQSDQDSPDLEKACTSGWMDGEWGSFLEVFEVANCEIQQVVCGQRRCILFLLPEFSAEESQLSCYTHDGLLIDCPNSNGACVCGECERNTVDGEGESCGCCEGGLSVLESFLLFGFPFQLF